MKQLIQFFNRYKKGILTFFKWLMVPLVLGVLYYQLFVQTDINEAVEVFQQSFRPEGALLLLLCVLLMPINLGTEALKWQRLVKYLYPIGFGASFKSVFAGLSLSIFTPKRIGDYAGRIMLLKSHKKQAVVSLFVGNLSQGIANLILGLISLLFFLYKFENELPYSDAILGASIAFAVVLMLVMLYLYFRLDWVAQKLEWIPIVQKHKDVINVLYEYDNKTLIEILLYSLLKYIIFIVQFVLIIKAFGIDISMFWGIVCASGVFFVKTLLPIPSSVELATRGTIAIAFFGLFTDNNLGILVASILLWVINLALPAIIGSLIISKTKIDV